MPSTLTATETKRILVCDDDYHILELITHTLNLHNKYEVIGASNAGEVLDFLQNNHPLPDLLVLDLWLPDLDSDKLIPIIRSDLHLNDIPILLVSAVVNPKIIATELGVEDWLSKPFILDELEYKVEQLLNH